MSTKNTIYFDTSKLDKYGILSNIKIEEQKAGARVEIDEEKFEAANELLNENRMQLNTGKLNAKELAELDNFFEAICDFEDFYQYFGFESLREASKEQILFSERMRYLENLFNLPNGIMYNLLLGSIEFTNGCKLISTLNFSISLKLSIISFILNFSYLLHEQPCPRFWQ